jgi:hypothetical protein
MYHLAALYPPVRRARWLVLSRDQLMLLMAAVNELFLGLDIYLAHNLNGTIRTREWIPIVFGPAAGLLLLVAGLIALRRRPLASLLATLVLGASIVVGLLGAYFHLIRGVLPTGPAGERVSVDLLVWAPPVVGPLIFSLVGLWGVSAAWVEEPADSGILRLWGGRRIQLPYSKTRAYLFMVSLGTLATLLSSVLDHGRAQFENLWLWPPVAAGVFAAVVAFGLAALERPRRADVAVYTLAMILLLVIGVAGFALHVQFDLTHLRVVVPERFLRGAPFLAPLLFANMGLVGLVALMDPAKQ